MQRDTSEGFRLSPGQEALWLAQREDRTFRATLAVRMQGKLQVDALKGAIEEAVRRHEILRTTFRLAGRKVPFQVVEEPPSFAFVEVDLRGSDGRSKLDALVTAEGSRAVDFERGPLLHATLARLGDEEHALILGLPALAADTASLGLLTAEVCHFYAKARAPSSASIVDEPLQYADFAEFQRERLTAEDEQSKAGKEHWKKQAESASPSLTIPFAGKVDAGARFAPARIPIAVGPEVSERLDALAKGHGGAVPAVLLAAWEALIARVTGQSELCVDVTVSGRHHEEVDGAIGLFSRVVPVQTAVEDDLPLGALVDRLSAALSVASRFQDFAPLDGAQERGVAFEWAAAVPDREAGGVVFSVLRQSSHAARFGVKLAALVGDGVVRVELLYDEAVFRQEPMASLASSVEVVLKSVAQGGSAAAVGALAVLSEAERRRLTEERNQTRAPFPEGKCLHELFEEQVDKTPDRPALAFEEQRLTYAELNARSNQLAHLLRRAGVGPDVRVGLCVPRGVEMIVGVLGIFKAGGAYVPLLSDSPRARLAHQLAEIEAKVVVTQEKLLGALSAFKGQIVCLDRDLARLADEPRSNPERVNQPSDLAYVIYTSGSTGTPKGVTIQHESLVNYTHFICAKLELAKTSGLHFASVSTLAADLGSTCIFPALTSGGCLHVISQERGQDGDLFAAYTRNNPIDVLKITPSHLAALLASAEGRHILPRRYLLTGGEASSWSLVQRVKELSPLVWINHYGPTETTIGSLTYDLLGNEGISAFASTVPLGRPIANTRVYILDARREPVPFGAPGELFIGGRGVARGYLNQPEQTSERFLPDPFSSEPSAVVRGAATEARMYRTGDRVRYVPDGSIEFLGRVDHQVKIRGFRVELGEIEAQLRKHPSVSQALVIAREDKDGELRIAAYVVPHPRGALPVEELRRALADELPDYMIPSAFVALDAFPMTPNGKIDRQALPAPEQARAVEQGFVGPRNPVEERIAAIWAEVLRIERISVHDNFFELGGHSLLATQVIARIRAAFRDAQIDLRTLFERPTIAALAENVKDDIGDLLAELDGYSEEEIQALLAAERGDG